MGEFLVSDYTRKGFIDGITVRLPTVVVRPGAPNAAASGFLSSIIREPLVGRPAILPVPVETAAWIGSPRVAVETLLHAAALPSERIGDQRRLSGRGLSVTVAEMIEALRDVAGPGVADRIRREGDPAVVVIVRSWPRRFEADGATKLGFPVDRSMQAIIEAHLHDAASGRLIG